ncbi:HD-GYP domain-containing protein [Rhodoferax aquaticus]|uniref:HD-GYP domain-containing protein n=1 Tax=Rhodoferax aquaticus TaxID=2527691 RepID=A0A515EN43_9BURK|nr:HD-GYP domain-containing protein [Rhodoferax aquaticus]QDL54097.1 HD-GYP domain-containing protein [Rhodoferax aquaticus]
MKKNDSNLLSIDQLRLGLFIELDVGWMAHPFPTGSFKLSSEKQIDTLRGLGLTHVRYVPEKSDLLPSTNASTERLTAAAQEAAAQSLALDAKRQARQDALTLQKRNAQQCERRFAETLRAYRSAMDKLLTDPKEVAAQCEADIRNLVHSMLDGESAITLLSETAGEKTAMHAVNVTIISLLLGKAMGLDEDELRDLGMAAFFHDMGKTKLLDRVRWPDDSFTGAETNLYQTHVGLGVQIGKTMELSKNTLLAMAQHHEWVDATGFPMRATGEGMTVAGKILSLVNRYDNLCNPSKVANALTPHESLSWIFAQQKTKFDATALAAFIRMMGVYPPGSVIQLADGRYASVVSVNSARPLKPKVLLHDINVPKHEALAIDLEHASHLTIRRSVRPATLPIAAQEYLAPRQRICYFFEPLVDPYLQGAKP